jgi:hypothetical protein
MADLYLNGVHRHTESPTLIADLKRAGYIEVPETKTVEKPAMPEEATSEPAQEAPKSKGEK